MVKLDRFLDLNRIEKLFAENNVREVEELGIEFGPRSSEICACFGSQECLDFLIEGGHGISSRINLHRIKRGESIIPLVNHDEELYYALVFGRDELLPRATSQYTDMSDKECQTIERPTARVALDTLVKLLDERTFDMVDYTSKIYPLYTQKEWAECISHCGSKAVSGLIKHKLYYFFDGSHLDHKAVEAIKRATKKQRRILKAHCSLPVSYLLKSRGCTT